MHPKTVRLCLQWRLGSDLVRRGHLSFSNQMQRFSANHRSCSAAGRLSFNLHLLTWLRLEINSALTTTRNPYVHTAGLFLNQEQPAVAVVISNHSARFDAPRFCSFLS